jgi:predicted nucleic acid-binding protein
MAYLDTNVIIAYCFPRDNNHRNAKSLITKLQELGVKELYHSPLTLVSTHTYLGMLIFSIFLKNLESSLGLRNRECV